MPQYVVHSTAMAATAARIYKDENNASASSLLCSVRIGYYPQSRRKQASQCRRTVAHPQLLRGLSADLSTSAKVRFGPQLDGRS
jgi:hypothetical protein